VSGFFKSFPRIEHRAILDRFADYLIELQGFTSLSYHVFIFIDVSIFLRLGLGWAGRSLLAELVGLGLRGADFTCYSRRLPGHLQRLHGHCSLGFPFRRCFVFRPPRRFSEAAGQQHGPIVKISDLFYFHNALRSNIKYLLK
jgi:hypothetical protein